MSGQTTRRNILIVSELKEKSEKIIALLVD
jgi:hypothetical protein